MATEPQDGDDLERSAPDLPEKGLLIFTYPKTIFLVPTLIVSIVCGLGMLASGDRIEAPPGAPPAAATSGHGRPSIGAPPPSSPRRPIGARNLLAMAFLGVF